MKKILIINTTYSRGGAAKVAREIFEHISISRKYNVYFTCGRKEKTKNEKIFSFGNKIEFYLHAFLVRSLGIEGYGSYFSTRKLINFIKKEKFDLIHLHNLHGYYLNFFTLVDFLKSSKIPVIWTFHDEWPINPLSAYSYGCSHCKTGKGKCVNNYTYPKTYNKMFLNLMFQRKRKAFASLEKLTIACPSSWLKERVKDSYLKNFNAIVVPNGVDVNLFKPVDNKKELREKYDLPVNKKIVFFSAVGFKEKRKGINHVIEISRLLKNKNVLFLGAGKGNIPNAENIYNFGYVSDKKTMADLYALSDIYIFPSLAEIMPLSVLEAMASGLPVVGFEIGPMKELISRKEGILTQVNDSESLAESIKEILENNDLKEKMSFNTREKVVNRFSLNKMIKEYESIYNNTNI